jgi:hypothetical protein
MPDRRDQQPSLINQDIAENRVAGTPSHDACFPAFICRLQGYVGLTNLTQVLKVYASASTKHFGFLKIIFPARCVLGRLGTVAISNFLRKMSGSSNLEVLVLQVHAKRGRFIQMHTLSFPSLFAFRTNMRHAALQRLLLSSDFVPNLVDIDVGPCKVSVYPLRNIPQVLRDDSPVQIISGPALCVSL